MNLISKLASELSHPTEEVIAFLQNASIKYKVYKIPKRVHGFRIIAQPSSELKEYQRKFLCCYRWPVHSCALGYRKHKNILHNAQAHIHSQYLLKLDLQDFFLRITPDIFWQQCELNAVDLYQDLIETKSLVNQLLFWSPSKKAHGKLVLSIGAPTSPIISNFCMFLFDQKLFDYCNRYSIVYTRYADDLTFSANNRVVLEVLYSFVKGTLKEVFNGTQSLNESKTLLISKRHNRHVTGLVLTNDEKVSLGRLKKRWIKGLIHRYIQGQLSHDEISHLVGWLSYIRSVEPSFLIRLEQKYSEAIILKIKEEMK